MLPRSSGALLSSPASRCLIFLNSSDRSHPSARRRWSAPACPPCTWTRLAGGSRTSPRSHVSVRVRCYAAGSPAEAGTTVKRESSETEGTALEVESGVDAERDGAEISVGIGSPSLPVQLRSFKMSHGDQAFFVLAFIACTTSVAFTSLVIAAIPTLCAIKRAAISLAKLADTARVELPSTMAAIRLSGMEISDLTLELSDLSQEIADGVNKSAQAVQAAEAGIRKIGHLARHQTMTIIQERASLPDISLQPMVEGAAKNTSHAIKQVRKTFLNIISRGEDISDRVDD